MALTVLQDVDVSIHAPARGATLDAASAAVNVECFNPRPREGGDRDRAT